MFFEKSLILMAFLASLTMVGCAPQGSSLAGDYAESSLCPESGCADPTPQLNQVAMKDSGINFLQSKAVITNNVVTDFVEFSGECYPSTYPHNKITVSITRDGNPVTVTYGTNVISLIGGAANMKCVQGRYSIAIDGKTLAPPAAGATVAGFLYKVVFTLHVSLDGTDYIKNANTGFFDVDVTRTR